MPTEKHHHCKMSNCNYNSTSLHRYCKTVHKMGEFTYEIFKFLIMYFHCAMSMQVEENYIFFKNAITGEEIIRVRRPIDTNEEEETTTRVEINSEPENVPDNIQHMIDIPSVQDSICSICQPSTSNTVSPMKSLTPKKRIIIPSRSEESCNRQVCTIASLVK